MASDDKKASSKTVDTLLYFVSPNKSRLDLSRDAGKVIKYFLDEDSISNSYFLPAN